jgi:hypothetical protein
MLTAVLKAVKMLLSCCPKKQLRCCCPNCSKSSSRCWEKPPSQRSSTKTYSQQSQPTLIEVSQLGQFTPGDICPFSLYKLHFQVNFSELLNNIKPLYRKILYAFVKLFPSIFHLGCHIWTMFSQPIKSWESSYFSKKSHSLYHYKKYNLYEEKQKKKTMSPGDVSS